MSDNRNRQRPIQVKFFVNEKELDLIKQKMEQMGTDNMSAYLRKMATDGYDLVGYIPVDKMTKAEQA